MIVALLLALQASPPSPGDRAPAEFRSPRVRESSGVAVSRAQPGVLWTHNDSGDGPYLYATDLSGRDRGRLRVAGARAVDWEAIALGPCPQPVRAPTGAACLYVGDTGDNNERRDRVTVYAFREPEAPTGPGDTLRSTAEPVVLRLRYPDGSHDVEAVYVSSRDSALYLVSKGHSGPIRLYRVAAQQWESAAADDVVRATRVQTLDIRPSREAGRLVTGAAIRPDARVVAIRTYLEVYLFYTGIGGRLYPARERPCGLAGLDRGGEAIDFLSDTVLVLTSEAGRRRPGVIATFACPLGEE
ncbi:MAG: hypothetical protein ACREX3_01975 [Gammaproteobacteria bacterium]